jgi:hypothetical protein
MKVMVLAEKHRIELYKSMMGFFAQYLKNKKLILKFTLAE